MKKLTRKILGWLLCLGWVVIIACGFLAYIVTAHDPNTKIVSDGLGRQLYDAPWLVRMFLFGSDRWPGLGWFVADFVIFWGFAALSYYVVTIREKLDDSVA
jgi:hypothetical protein